MIGGPNIGEEWIPWEARARPGGTDILRHFAVDVRTNTILAPEMMLVWPNPFPMTLVRNPHVDAVIASHNQSLQAAQEREKVLEAVRGKTLDQYQAELVCAALAWLGEM